VLDRLTGLGNAGPLTLLYAAHAGEISNAAVLRRLLVDRQTPLVVE
jgi:hypothetical protein